MRELKPYIECGKIINKHGLAGDVKAECWLDSAKDFAAVRTFYLDAEGKRKLYVQKNCSLGNFMLVRFDSVDTPEKAYALKNTVLYAARADLKIPEGRVLICDLIGLPVFDVKNGDRLGVLNDMIKNPANDIYVVGTDNGERLVPAVDEFLDHIDLDTGIYLNIIEGMF